MASPKKTETIAQIFGLGAGLWLSEILGLAQRFDEITAPLTVRGMANALQLSFLVTARETLLPKLLGDELNAENLQH